MQHGKNLEWYEQAEAEGERVKPLENKPELYSDLKLDFDAFNILSTSRPVGFSYGAIPISEILAYCNMFGIDDYEERKEFIKRIKILDRAYLNFHNKKSKQANKKTGK